MPYIHHSFWNKWVLYQNTQWYGGNISGSGRFDCGLDGRKNERMGRVRLGVDSYRSSLR